jgi:ketosteroid isomerase-like protein
MGTESPRQAHERWAEAFAARDVDALLELYEDGAVLVPEPSGEAVAGKAAVHDVLAGFVGMGADFDVQSTRVVDGDGVALVFSKWRLSGGTGPDGNPLDMTGETTDVIRRQPDGTWLFAIDNPFGVA